MKRVLFLVLFMLTGIFGFNGCASERYSADYPVTRYRVKTAYVYHYHPYRKVYIHKYRRPHVVVVKPKVVKHRKY